MRYSQKRVHPGKIIAGLREVFKTVSLKKTSQRNFFLILTAVCVSKTFRINAIASRLPISVETEKSKQKRVLRFLESPFPSESVMEAWLAYIIGCLWRSKRKPQQAVVLIDETDLPGGWKAIVAAIPFRNRAIPIYWHIYKNEEITDGTYKSHNEIIQDFCLDVRKHLVEASGDKGVEPVLVFDRGFARARYVIKFLDEKGIRVVMRVPRNVGVYVNGSLRKLDDLKEGSHRDILYHTTEALPLNLYVVRDNAFKDPMYLISNRKPSGPQIHTCYKRRMQIEHGFRDIKSCFKFKQLVLKKKQKPRIGLLFLIAVFAYGLLFVTYEKSAGIWAKTVHPTRKIFSVINVIKNVITDTWTQEKLLLFSQQTCLRNLDFLATQ